MAQHKMRELDDRFKVRIISHKSTGRPEIVEAPLPDQFGVTVGSEFSAPFDGNLVSGSLAKVAALQGVAKKTGTSGRKMYSNPEPSEISIDLEFEAYYSAKEEVVLPVALLMAMSLGTTLDSARLEQNMLQYLSLGDNLTGFNTAEEVESVDIVSEEQEEWSDRIMELIGFLQGPRKVRVHFGRTMVLPSVWVASVAPQFSNVLDPNGFPMSATVSVTFALEMEPVVEDLNQWFSNVTEQVSDRSTRGGNE